MNVIEVVHGTEPPDDKPRITITARGDGSFAFYGVSESLDIQLDPRVFESRAAAQGAAISWATAHNYADIYLVTNDA